MDSKDGRLDPVRTFTAISFRLDADKWREFVSNEENQFVFNSFFTAQEYRQLFIHREPESELCLGLNFPRNVRTKVICVSKTGSEVISAENSRKLLSIQEVQGDDILSFVIDLCDEVICPLLSNPQTRSRYAEGVADEALKFMERQKNESLVMKAQMEGQTFLPYPDAEGRELSAVELLHSCDTTIIEWAELLSEFLLQDSSQALLDGQKSLPSEEFSFWKNRLKNLLFIQQQLRSGRAQQVVSIVQEANSVYWSTLRDIHRDVQEGLKEAEDVTENLKRLQEKLEEVEQMEYHQLEANMADVMEEVRLLWVRSEFYCRPARVTVLLREICNLLILMSRKFLRGEEVLRGLVSDPAAVLDDVRLVIRTLQRLKEAYRHCRTQLDHQNQVNVSPQGGDAQRWDFPSALVFVELDNLLTRLQNIQAALCVTLQLRQLGGAVLSGPSSTAWNAVVQDVYQDFLRHVTFLSECHCDPTDSEDQSFDLHLRELEAQVCDLERRLASVLSRALEEVSVLQSAAQLLNMFSFLLDRPLIQHQLRPHLVRLANMALTELDQVELLFSSQREESETFSGFGSTAVAQLSWSRKLVCRASDALRSYKSLHRLCDSGFQQVIEKFQHVFRLLQDFRNGVKSAWSVQLDQDCASYLDQPVVQRNHQGLLEVACIQELFMELRYASREADVELRPHAARLSACREEFRRSSLSLTHLVSCYDQVVSDVLEVERPLIQDLLLLEEAFLELGRNSSMCEGAPPHLVERVLTQHATVSNARANMATMTAIIQGWAELHLLQRSGESLLEGGASQHSCTRIREEGEQLLKLTEMNRCLFGAESSSEAWIRYLDHIDDQVQDGLFQLLLKTFHFLSDNTKPEGCSAPLFMVRLQLQETGSVFEPSVGDGLSDLLETIIADVYTAASLPPRISASRPGNYQASLQQNPDLHALEEEVLHHLQQVREEAEHLRAELDRYSYLWKTSMRGVMHEFLIYSRQLGPEELEPEEAPPTLKDFQREIESLHRLSQKVTHLDDVTILHSWLQVDLRPFRDALLSLIQDWKRMYTDYLLDSVSDSVQQVALGGDDDDDEEPRLPLTETIILLEAAEVQLPEHLSARLQC